MLALRRRRVSVPRGVGGQRCGVCDIVDPWYDGICLDLEMPPDVWVPPTGRKLSIRHFNVSLRVEPWTYDSKSGFLYHVGWTVVLLTSISFTVLRRWNPNGNKFKEPIPNRVD